MSTSVGVSRASRESSSPAEVDLCLATAEKKQNPAADLRRIMAVCEALADLVTISIAIIAGYETYYHFELGKHIYYRTRSGYSGGTAGCLARVAVCALLISTLIAFLISALYESTSPFNPRRERIDSAKD